MELYTKNKHFNKILQPFLSQQCHDLKSKPFKKLEQQIRDFFHDLNENKENVRFLMQHEFFDTFRELSTNPCSVMTQRFRNHLSDLLKTFDNHKVNDIVTIINKCFTQIGELEPSLNSECIKKWFGEFCRNVSACLVKLSNRVLELSTETTKAYIIVHMIQLSMLLQLQLGIFEQELNNDLIISESRRFVQKRFRYHFDELRELLKSETEDETPPTFINWMDQCLDLLGIIETNKTLETDVKNTRPAIDEVLAHAMSTAQICAEDDSKAIKASIQTVLHEYSQLEKESKKYKCNPSVVKLHVDVVSDKLCILESRINTAVLRISLNAFSDSFGPLRILQEVCESTDVSILKRAESDLDDLILEFDLHVDRIMQIGLFAVACTTDKKILSKIKSSLTSLEALESELVPALTTLYMEPSQLSHLHATIFVNHWKSEVGKLKEAIFYIIDPIAFGQILREQYKMKLENVETIMKNEILEFENVKGINMGVDIFAAIVEASLMDLNLENDSVVSKQLKDLKDVNNEVEAACRLLMEPDRKSSERVLKRLQILLTVMERVLKTLSSDPNKKSLKKTTITPPKTEINISNIIDRGQQLLKDRSALFRTPKTVKKLPLATPRTGYYSEARKSGVSFVKKVMRLDLDESRRDTSAELHITNILEELTNLVDTLS